MSARRGRTEKRAPEATSQQRQPRRPRFPFVFAVFRFFGRLVRSLVFPVLAAAVVAGVVLLGMFPARAYVDQKEDIVDAQTRLDDLVSDNKRKEEELARLNTDAEIERVAREQLRLVKPGEEVYHIMPAPQDPLIVPDAWPFDGMRKRMRAQAPPLVDPNSTTTTVPAARPEGPPPIPPGPPSTPTTTTKPAGR